MGKHSHKPDGIFHKGDAVGGGRKRAGQAGDATRAVLRKSTVPGQPQLSDAASRRRGSLEAAPARLKVERERRQSRAKRAIAIAAIAALCVVVALAAGAYAYVKHLESSMQTTRAQSKNLKSVLKPAKPMQPYTMLLMGADYRPGDSAYRSDVIILAKIDPEQKKVWMLSIPRDTRAEVPGYGYHKINEAHFFGGRDHGPELAVKTVEKFTGVPINHYMEVNFQGFKGAVDALGGVWINVPVTIDDWKADASPGHRAKHIDTGYQLLDGNHALTFVRSRKFPDADFTRIKHQQLFFKALADQIAKKQNLTRLPGVVSAVAPYIKTDMALGDMIKTAQALKNAGSANMYMASVKGVWKTPYVYPDDTLKEQLVADLLAGRSFEPTPTAQPTTGSKSTAPGTTQTGSTTPAAKKPSQIDVTVRNGSGISGIAKQAASILKAKEFRVGDVGNANQNVYKETMVIYKTDRVAAELVASALPPGTKIIESRGMYSYTTEVLVVVGKDWDVSKVPVTPVQTN